MMEWLKGLEIISFDAPCETERYAVILRLLKARGPADRVARLRKELERLVAEARIE